MRILILAMLVSCPLLGQAEAKSPLLPQAKVAFERYTPGSSFDDDATAFGDFNGDGVTDFVTFITSPNDNDTGAKNLKIAAFLGAKDNTFNFYEASSEILGHERVSHDLEIKRQSIFLHRDGSGGCCSRWDEIFQFKLRDGQLKLIGLETNTIHAEDTDATDPDTGVSANLLTSQVIKWTDTGKRKQEKKITLPTLKPVPFKDFNYETFSDKWSGDLW